MLPLIAYNLLQSVQLLTTSSTVFADKCIKGITANQDKCASNLEQSLSLVTALVPEIGYDKAAAMAKEAHNTGKSVRQVAKEAGVLPEDKIDEILNRMISGK